MSPKVVDDFMDNFTKQSLQISLDPKRSFI